MGCRSAHRISSPALLIRTLVLVVLALFSYAVAPFHGLVFRTMLAGIQRDAIAAPAKTMK